MTGRSARQAVHARPQSSGRALANRASVEFPVVGLGASAGGLDAFRRFFDALPANCGMAFVLIQHLDPKHQSMMVDLLAGHTAMKVLQATDGTHLERDHVYLIPPGAYLAIHGGSLRLSKPRERHGARMPFDFFLRSLAEECGERAICAVLSGTGTDGSLGLKAVKEKGGLVIVQDPEEAAFDGMPRSAIMSGGADLVLTVARISKAVVRYGRQKYVLDARKGLRAPDIVKGAFTEIIELLAAKTRHDFSLYKQGTLQRRIERRMAMAGLESSRRYLKVLREDSNERDVLAKDLLINVTHFFRDPAAFDLLVQTVVPELVRQQTLDRPLRIWVPGCSTGEEAYSIAMLFLEQIATAERNIKLQVFASDIDADCVALGRNGVYPESIEADVTPARLARFFTKEDHAYQVVRELRETVVFTAQSLLTDAPFSRLDLVSCRNVLIYLSPEAQRKILSLFHFALREGGVLFLGSSETIGSVSDCFEPVSKKYRVYRHIGRSRPGEVEFPRGTRDAGRLPIKALPQQTAKRCPGFSELSQRALLEAYAPASVLINDRHEGLYYFGSVDRYLKVASGEGTRDILAMARDGLRAKLRSAVQLAEHDHASVTLTGARVKRNGSSIRVRVTARPIESDGKRLVLVSFVDDLTPEPRPVTAVDSAIDAFHVAQLEEELEVTREDLQSAIRDLEIANEEQKAINEEAMSVNEEFQSTNEELETSKEELQSLNEELTVLNSQLHETVEQQRATSDDLQNILNSTDVATLFLDGDLNIRFFTPAAKSLFSIITSDVGRPLADFTRRFEDDDLLREARAVLATRAPVRREVKAHDGSWFIRGILPYRSDDSNIDGVVITFAGISEIKAAERALEAAKSEAERANAGKSRFLAAASHDLRQPLQTISLLQGTLEKRVRDEPTLKLVHRLDETVSTMSSLLDKLLDINQLEAGIVRPTIIDFPIKGLLDELKTEFTYHTTANGLDWRVVLSSVAVRSDPCLLEQIIRNLLSNAVKYTTEGKLLLGCRRRGDKLRIEVCDTGPGIPELELKAIFEEFHQLDNPARERSKGLGLGLAIVQRLADLLGHKIDVRSRVGAGSVFTIEVPLGRPEAADLPVAGQDEIPESTPSRGTILIVEDDPAGLEMLQLLFDDEGHRTLVAADAHKALELADQGATVPDLVIADYNLPKGINGLEMIARLQKQVRHTIPAIILTGDISSNSLLEIARQGCAHLNKPVRAKELTRLAHRLLAKPNSAGPASAQQLRLRLEGDATSTVFVVDDDCAIREAMGDLLQQNGYSVELFGDGATFLQAYRPGREGCLLVDVLMPAMSGVQLIERLKAEGYQLPAIVITGSGDVPMAVQAMKAGAVDFIEKPVGHAELLASVKRALDQTRDMVTLSACREKAVLRIASLTTRQRQILDLVLVGHPSKNIAADLGISQRTVDNHRAAIMRKTGSKSLPALIRTALAAT
jgi:two-component system, chemotaxis family, CheB/CheR fusion protein